jgi:hypothetical protein
MAKVETSGVYRDSETGHAMYLAEGNEVSDEFLARYSLDQAATDEHAAPPEGGYLNRGVTDAPQDREPEARGLKGAPENKAMSQPGETKTDAQLAADAAKRRP